MGKFNDDQLKSKLNSVLLDIGKVDVFEQFAPAVIAGLGHLISFEQAVVFSLDAKGNVVDSYLLNVSSNWVNAYFEYYIQLADTVVFDQNVYPRAISWADIPLNEFTRNCIQNRNLRYSIHFLLHDTRGRQRFVCSLDRVQNIPFSQTDLDVLQELIPHLDNLHRKFFLSAMPYDKRLNRMAAMMDAAELTKREKELVEFLCDGVSPLEISQFLHVAPATIHKHIAHIYKKMEVKTLQELLVRMLNERSTPRTRRSSS